MQKILGAWIAAIALACVPLRAEEIQLRDGESQIQLDGKNGIRMIWRGKNAAANKASMKSLVYIVLYENRMVRLTFLTLEPLFGDGVPIFEKIASSYQTAATQTK